MTKNPLIGDSFFKENPSNILGEQSVVKGRFDSEIIKVKGDLSDIERIDAVPVAIANDYPTQNLTQESKQEIIDAVVSSDFKEQAKKRLNRIKRKEAKNLVPLEGRKPQEVYSTREVGEMYNKNISKEELDAYYYTHPELDHKLLFDSYTSGENELIEKGLMCYDENKWVYFYTYISGNVNKKISILQRDKDKIISVIGLNQYERQMKMLMDVKPAPKGFVGDNKIILLPHSNFAKEIKINELRSSVKLYGATNLFDAFRSWLRTLTPDSFKKSNYQEIIDYYLDNKAIKGEKSPTGKKDDRLSKQEQVKQEKNAINIRQRTKEEGDELFAQFLAEELLPEDQAKVSYLWNEKFNSIVEPNLEKIPVALQISKTFKAGSKFIFNPTQRQAIAFQQEKKSGLLAYGVGVGKGHLLTSDILTPNGFKKMGDIAVGDEVIGSDGNATKVTGVFPLGKIQCYEVVFSDGSKTQVSKDHLWKVQKIKNRENKNGLFHVLETEKIIEHGLYTNRGDYYYSIPMVAPINFNEKELPLHPYLLGCLIGDGSMSEASNRVAFSNSEPDVINKVRSLLPISAKLVCYDITEPLWNIVRIADSGSNEVLDKIKALGLNVKSNGKFIPSDYLFNSVENRLEILRGLLDTDGYISDSPSKRASGKKGCSIIYTTVSERLANDIKLLVQSFGGIVSINTKNPSYTYNGEKRQGQLAYNITINLPSGIIPVSSMKQRSKFVEKTKYPPVRFIEAINDIGEHEAQCISVDAYDHLYVCEECIVTHNTGSAIGIYSQGFYNGLVSKGIFVVPTNTYDKWIGELSGYTDRDTGIFMEGLLPQLPVVGLYNLNPLIVREKVKQYSPADEDVILSIQQAIEMVKGSKNSEVSGEDRVEINRIYNVNWSGLRHEYEIYLNAKFESNSGSRAKDFKDFVVNFLKEELNYNIYTLGEVRNFEDGTIFVITEVGLQRLGVGEDNKEMLKDRMFTILSQGEKSADAGERDIAQLELRIEQTISSSMKNAKIQIEDLGINWCCFDEAHYYKKLFTYVKGDITNKEEVEKGRSGKYKREKSKYELKSGQYPSARALSAFVLSMFVQMNNDNRNVIMLTATPFTNSPLEVYSMLTLTNFEQLEELGLANMTDFFDTFMKINYDIKYTPQKTVVKDIVLQGYNNLSQLRSIIYSLMDKKDEGANLIRPTKIVMPSIQNGVETTLPMTQEQTELMAAVKRYINGGEDYGAVCQSALLDEIENLDFDGLDDETLIGEWERSTEKEYSGERENLSETQREKLVSAIKSARVKGTELEEGDLDESEGLGVRILRGLSMMRQITLSPYLYYKACNKVNNTVNVLPDYKDYINSSPKLTYVMGCIKSTIAYHKERNEKISGSVIYTNEGVEYFPLIKQYAVKELGLKESQVGMVTGKMSKSAKETVKRQFLSGDILVLIGSSTISVGVDLQNNSSTLYNCYYDWNPTDAAQIEGRIWRQGNRFAFVRIVYPQCFNSADPIIFEYLNAKTLRINEIWNRSSTVQELDLRDFNPKELQKKLITDPEEKAAWEILEESDKVESQIIYFENRAEMLQDAMGAFRRLKNDRGSVIKILNEVSNKKIAASRKEAVDNYNAKVADIVKVYDHDPVKMGAEINKYKASRYDHINDPDNKYAPKNYNDADDATLYVDAFKYIDLLRNMTYRDANAYGDLASSGSSTSYKLSDFRSNYKDMKAAEDKVLKPMGLTFETALNPIVDFNNKIESLKEELQAIEDTREQRIERIKNEMAAEGGFKKTVQDRINEFAADNEKYLSKFLIAPTLIVEDVVIEEPVQEPIVVEKVAPVVEEPIVVAEPIQEEPIIEEEPIIVEPEVVEEPIVEAQTVEEAIEEKEEEIDELSAEIIENQIKGLTLILSYKTGEAKKAIKRQIKALEMTLELV